MKDLEYAPYQRRFGRAFIKLVAAAMLTYINE